MVNLYLMFLPILLAVNVTLGVKSGGAFTYIGSLKSRGIIEARNAGKLSENDYYISMNVAPWSIAVGDCKSIFGPDANLLTVETMEEWNFLKVTLEKYSFGSTFWTSGMYDAGSKEWKWSANNQPLIASAPWDIGQPTYTPNPLHRVIIYHGSRYSAFWRTVTNTQLHRYVCENILVACSIIVFQCGLIVLFHLCFNMLLVSFHWDFHKSTAWRPNHNT